MVQEVSAKWEVPASTRIINILRMLFPGEWKLHGNAYWEGPDFNVFKREGKYYRSDTELEIVFPARKKRNHFIVDILKEKLGGEWTRYSEPEPICWRSPDHDFIIYISSYLGRTAYRRSDTRKVVYKATSNRFYK